MTQTSINIDKLRENLCSDDAVIEVIQDEGRRNAARDIILDLKDFLADPKAIPTHERAGMQAAIEIIQANYGV